MENALLKLEEIMERRLGVPKECVEENVVVDSPQSSDPGSGDSDLDGSELESEVESVSGEGIKGKRPHVQVIEHDDSRFSRAGTSQSTDKSEFRSFMSSKVKLVDNAGSERLAKRFKSSKELDREKLDRNNDRELEALIKTSKIVEKFNAEQLTGKDRHKHMKHQLQKLGGKAELSPSARAPKPIRLGMERKQVERAEKRLQEAKDMGMYHKKTKHIYEDPVLKKKAEPDQKRKWDRRRDINKPSVGKFKNGILTIGKHDIERTTSAKKGGSKKRSKR